MRYSGLKLLPELNRAPAMKDFIKFDAAALGDGALPAKTKRFIALGVALTTQCLYCLEIYNKAARKLAATDDEIAEVTLVAAALRAGAAITYGLHLFNQRDEGHP